MVIASVALIIYYLVTFALGYPKSRFVVGFDERPPAARPSFALHERRQSEADDPRRPDEGDGGFRNVDVVQEPVGEVVPDEVPEGPQGVVHEREGDGELGARPDEHPRRAQGLHQRQGGSGTYHQVGGADPEGPEAEHDAGDPGRDGGDCGHREGVDGDVGRDGPARSVHPLGVVLFLVLFPALLAEDRHGTDSVGGTPKGPSDERLQFLVRDGASIGQHLVLVLVVLFAVAVVVFCPRVIRLCGDRSIDRMVFLFSFLIIIVVLLEPPELMQQLP